MIRPIARPLVSSLVRPRADAVLNLTPQTREFVARSGITDGTAISDIDGLVLGLADLGFSWDDWAFVPCNAPHGGLHYLGGWATQNATIAGTAAVGVRGVEMASWDTAAPGAFADYITGPRALTDGSRDFTWFICGSHNGALPAHGPSQYLMLAVNAGSFEYNALARGLTNSSDATIISYYDGTFCNMPNSDYSTLFTSGIGWVASMKATDLRHDGLLFGGYAHTGTTTGWGMIGNVETTVPNHSSISWITPRFTVPCPVDSGITGTVHGLAFWRGNPTAKRAEMRRIQALLGSTIWNYGTRGFFTNVHLAGQSNAGGVASPLESSIGGGFRGMSQVTAHQIGGTYIADATIVAGYKKGWVDDVTGNPGYYFNQGIAPWIASRPVQWRGRYRNVFVWIQGESDATDLSLTQIYLQREERLFANCRAAIGDPNTVFIIGLTNWHRSFRDASDAEARSGGAQANFLISGMTGTTAVLNGTWLCDVLPADDPGWTLDAFGNVIQTNPANYSWTISGHKLRRQNGRWEFTRNSDDAVVCASSQNPAHPYLVTTWICPLGVGTSPVIPYHRTAGIELMRQVKETHANLDINYRFVDMRGCEYAATDAAGGRVHLNANGWSQMADRIAAVIDAL